MPMHMLLAKFDLPCSLGYISSSSFFFFFLAHWRDILPSDSIRVRQSASPIIHQPTPHTSRPYPASQNPSYPLQFHHPPNPPFNLSPSSSSSPLLLPTTTTNSSSSFSFSTNTLLNKPSKRALSSCSFAILVAKKCNFASRSRTWRSLRSRKAR